ncbi:MAG: lytic transglycosylase domain-containing protein [Pseudolabrys sp.]
MRQLIVPACACLLTWSVPTAHEPSRPIEKFTKTLPRDAEPATLDAKASTADANVVIARTIPAELDANAYGSSNSSDAQNSSDAKDAADLLAPAVTVDIPMQTEIADTAELEIVKDVAADPPPPPPKPVIHRSRQEVCDTLTKAAAKNDLPVPFFIRLLFQESRFKPGVVSRAGAQGIAQFMPETANSVGLDNPFDPLQAIPASARLLRDLFQQFGNLGLAAAAYNAGPKRIQDWLTKKGKLPQETQGYVKTITGRPVETWTVAAAGHPGVRLPRNAPCQEAAGLYAWDGPEVVPLPAPRTHTVYASASNRAAAVNSHVKITRTASRVTAVIKIEKPAKKAGTHGSKVAAEQLTARKQKSAKVAHNEKPAHGHKHKSQKIAQK